MPSLSRPSACVPGNRHSRSACSSPCLRSSALWFAHDDLTPFGTRHICVAAVATICRPCRRLLRWEAGGTVASMAGPADPSTRLAEFDAAYTRLRDELLELERTIEPLERRRRELRRSFAQLLTVARRAAGDPADHVRHTEAGNKRDVRDGRATATRRRNSEKPGGSQSTAESGDGAGGPDFEASERVMAVIGRIAPDLPASLEAAFRAMLVLELDQAITSPLPREVAAISGADTTKGRAATHSYLKRLAKRPSPALVEQVSTNPARFRLADSVREVARSA